MAEVDLTNKSQENDLDLFLIKYYSDKCNIDPREALFIISYPNEFNMPVVVFNSFSIVSPLWKKPCPPRTPPTIAAAFWNSSPATNGTAFPFWALAFWACSMP